MQDMIRNVYAQLIIFKNNLASQVLRAAPLLRYEIIMSFQLACHPGLDISNIHVQDIIILNSVVVAVNRYAYKFLWSPGVSYEVGQIHDLAIFPEQVK